MYKNLKYVEFYTFSGIGCGKKAANGFIAMDKSPTAIFSNFDINIRT